MSDDIILRTGNVAIVQSQGSTCLMPQTISVQDLPDFYGTVSLPIAHSTTIVTVEDKLSELKLLFGSWNESGDEDTQLDELYKSRLFPSITING